MDYKEAVKNCTNCNICKNNCVFLTKYDINIGDVEQLYDLAYHCFLCGRCNQVCPEKIRGRDIILAMRQEIGDNNGGKPPGKGYKSLIMEKSDYLFKNYSNIKNAAPKSLLFPGCNFISLYPKTLEKLKELLEPHGILMALDCCGKPIGELGMVQQEQLILDNLEAQFKKAGATELITLCPNCYYYLKDRLSIPVVFIYPKLKELGIGKKIHDEEVQGGKIQIFPPCPDRESWELLKSLEDFLPQEYSVIKKVQCCGLGGVARAREKELSFELPQKIAALGETAPIYTYCATCSGSIKRSGAPDVRHLLTRILGTEEQPDVKKSFVNRGLSKFL